jgi:hypothetical protein
MVSRKLLNQAGRTSEANFTGGLHTNYISRKKGTRDIAEHYYIWHEAAARRGANNNYLMPAQTCAQYTF